LLKIIADWHILCDEILNYDLEILLTERRFHPRLSNNVGQSVALPNIVNEKVVMCVYLDEDAWLDNYIISHELCHQRLKLKGLKTIRNLSDPQCFIENMINTLFDHPLVYKLHKEYGGDVNQMKKKQVKSIMNIIVKDIHMKKYRGDIFFASIHVADTIFNSPINYSRRLKEILKRDEDLEKKVNIILSIMKKSDIYNYDSNLTLRFNIIKEFNIKGEWIIHDDLKKLKNIIYSN